MTESDPETQRLASEYARALESEIPDDVDDARNKLAEHIENNKDK